MSAPGPTTMPPTVFQEIAKTIELDLFDVLRRYDQKFRIEDDPDKLALSKIVIAALIDLTGRLIGGLLDVAADRERVRRAALKNIDHLTAYVASYGQRPN